MSYIRKHRNKWQSIVRIKGYPSLARSFDSKTDARKWSAEVELKIRREDAGIARRKLPTFRECCLRYLNEVSIHKRTTTLALERCVINQFIKESWSEYPIHKITPLVTGRYRDKQREEVEPNTLNRKLDIISTIFTHCRKEWGYAVENPVLSIKRPRNNEPRDRRLSDREINLLLRGNHTDERMRAIISIALETAMRQSEILRIHPDHLRGSTLYIPVAKTRPRTIPLTKKGVALIKNAQLPFNMDRYLLGKKFRKLCKLYRIKDAHFHDLRRNSLVNFMKDKGLNVPETMLIAGHADPRMLLRIYNNLQVDHVAKKLN